jgi:hypothetical protein
MSPDGSGPAFALYALAAGQVVYLSGDRFALAQRSSRVRKAIPEKMFTDAEQSRLALLRNWVLDNGVTQIAMNERQFWMFASLQPVAEKPWTTFMGRPIIVSDMPEEAQKYLGVFDRHGPGVI